ncbi:integrase, catalytic region, zinc finger, CCHC-type containing protein [Tanacetum coccineum]
MGNILILRVYYVEGLGHNLFFIGKFCDSDLEVAFRKHTCFVRNLEGVDLLSGSRGSNLYTISIADMMKSSLVCLLSKASKTKSWLLHRRLSHLNFGTINQLAKQGLVKGFPKLKYTKDHLRGWNYSSYIHYIYSTTKLERRNRTLVEAARTMLIFSNSPLFLWAEAVATACYTQNHSLIHTRYNKTPFELLVTIRLHMNCSDIANQNSSISMFFVLYDIQQTILRILGNYSQKQILESSLVIHHPRRRTESTTKGTDK